MITIVTGVPGSGKSYFAVHMISKLKDHTKLLHNIDGLKLGITLDDFCHSSGHKALDLFTTEFHESDNSFRGYLFVLDECQTLFPKNFRNESVQRFFQLHRHYGIDIILLSQDYKLICPSIALLSESQFRAVSDTANPLPGTFMYRKMIGYENIGRTFLRKKKSVFDLYKTADFDQKEVRKKSRPMLYLGIFALLLIAFGVYRFFHVTSDLSTPDSPSQTSSGPLPLDRFKQLTSKSSDSFSSSSYPSSLDQLYHGHLIPVSHVTDWRGTYIPFLGLFFEIKDFPYPLHMTRTGFVAVVPADVYEFALSYRSSIPEPDTQDSFSSEAASPAQAPAREAEAPGQV